MSGMVSGNIICGILSDRFGRKSAISIFTQIVCGCGILASVTSTFEVFCLLWFFVGKEFKCTILLLPVRVSYHAGLGSTAVFNAGLIWTIEIVGGKWKSIGGILLSSVTSNSVYVVTKYESQGEHW